jgi:hypothetical protein
MVVRVGVIVAVIVAVIVNRIMRMIVAMVVLVQYGVRMLMVALMFVCLMTSMQFTSSGAVRRRTLPCFRPVHRKALLGERIVF